MEGFFWMEGGRSDTRGSCDSLLKVLQSWKRQSALSQVSAHNDRWVTAQPNRNNKWKNRTKN